MTRVNMNRRDALRLALSHTRRIVTTEIYTSRWTSETHIMDGQATGRERWLTKSKELLTCFGF